MDTSSIIKNAKRHYALVLFLFIASVAGFVSQCYSMFVNQDTSFHEWFTVFVYMLLCGFFAFRSYELHKEIK